MQPLSEVEVCDEHIYPRCLFYELKTLQMYLPIENGNGNRHAPCRGLWDVLHVPSHSVSLVMSCPLVARGLPCCTHMALDWLSSPPGTRPFHTEPLPFSVLQRTIPLCCFASYSYSLLTLPKHKSFLLYFCILQHIYFRYLSMGSCTYL